MVQYTKALLSCRLLSACRTRCERYVCAPIETRNYRRFAASAGFVSAPLSSGASDYSLAWLICFLFLLAWALFIAVHLTLLWLTDETGLPNYSLDQSGDEPQAWDAKAALRQSDDRTNRSSRRAPDEDEIVEKAELRQRNKGASLSPAEARETTGARDDTRIKTPEPEDHLSVLRR
jgi:hypothetical protein